MATYRSPVWPPLAALPSPDSLTLSPLSTPEGILTESDFVSCLTPAPLQDLQ